MTKQRKIIWDNEAAKQFKEIFEFVRIDSLQAAIKIRSEIFATTSKIPPNPKLFAADKLKDNNDGSFRAFTIFHYRISYQITETEILILRIRHTSREAEKY